MNIDLVFKDEEQLTLYLFHHLISRLMYSFQTFEDIHKNCSLWYTGPSHADNVSSDDFEILDCAYIYTYIRNHPGEHERVSSKRIASIYAVRDLIKDDGTCHISIRIPDNNMIIEIQIDKVYSSGINSMIPRANINLCSIDENVECDQSAVQYYKDMFNDALKQIISDSAFFKYDDDGNITGYSN